MAACRSHTLQLRLYTVKAPTVFLSGCGIRPMDIGKLVGPDAIDPLREADYYVQPFQSRTHFAEAPARIAAFECFVLRCLDQFQSHPGLKRFGLAVTSKVGFDRECVALPKITVDQKVTLIVEGDPRPLVDVEEFYTACFPFSGVYDGEFALDREDPRVQRYLDATARKDHDERRCMVALLAAEAAEAYSAPSLEIRLGR